MQAVCMELLPLFFQLKCKPWCAVCGNYYSCIFKTVIFQCFLHGFVVFMSVNFYVAEF